MPLTSTGVIGPGAAEWYDRILLTTAYPALVYGKFAQQRTLPTKNSKTITMRRYEKLASVPVPITEGVTPPGTSLSKTDINATVSWYANFITLTDQVQAIVEDPLVTVCAERLSQNMAETMDEIVRDVLVSCTNVVTAAGGSNTTYVPTNLSKADIDLCVRTLLGNDALMIEKVIAAEGGVGTLPVRPAFMGILHTDLLADLESVEKFNYTSNYPSQAGVMDFEWGQTGNVRWLYTTKGYKNATGGTKPNTATGSTTTTTQIPSYTLPIVGKEAYARVSLGGNAGEMFVKPLGSAGSADPVNLLATVGWKIPFVCRILNDNFMVNLNVTAADS